MTPADVFGRPDAPRMGRSAASGGSRAAWAGRNRASTEVSHGNLRLGALSQKCPHKIGGGLCLHALTGLPAHAAPEAAAHAEALPSRRGPDGGLSPAATDPHTSHQVGADPPAVR